MDSNREDFIKALSGVGNRVELIRNLQNSLVSFGYSIKAIRIQQHSILDALSQLGANVPQKMSYGAKIVLLAMGLGMLGGGTFLFYFRKQLKQKWEEPKDRPIFWPKKTTEASRQSDQLGGIALAPKLMNMQIWRDGSGTAPSAKPAAAG